MKTQQSIYKAVLKYYEAENLTPKQKKEIRIELENISGYFWDGFDRALALESHYHWGSITTELVNILDGGKR